MQSVLRNALVTEKICAVDRSNSFYIHNPYNTQPAAAIQAIAGTYSVSAWTTVEDSLTVTDEVIYGEHVFDFEKKLAHYDIIANRFDEMAYAVAFGVDKLAVNWLLTDGTGTYTTPAGGFTTAANIPVIISNLCSKVMGYSDVRNGLFLVIENTDVPGFIQAQIASGFSYADAALRNGFMASYAGVDIYVLRSGTFVSTTLGSKAVVCSGHRVFGVKGVSTYAQGTPIYEEKGVTGKTGKEIAYGTTFGFKLWTQKAGLIVDVTLA